MADGPGRISIERDPTKHDSERQIAIVRPKRTLHPSFTEGSVLLIDATGNLDHVRQLLPDVVEIAPPLPVAPHQTVVHFAMVAAGKRAMRRPGNKAYHQAIAELYAGDGDGLLTHKEHAADFAGTQIIRRGHYFALTGRRDWQKCSTVLAFGLPSLSPHGAATLAAAQTGEAIAVEMPRRVLHPVPMRDGSTEYVVCLGYANPAIRAAQQSVTDRQAIQGPAGRPRGPNRTADDRAVPDLYRAQAAARRARRCVASFMGRACAAAVRPRRRGRKDCARQSGSQPVASVDLPARVDGFDDRKHEIGSTIATLKRVLFPPWRTAKGLSTRPWCTGL